MWPFLPCLAERPSAAHPAAGCHGQWMLPIFPGASLPGEPCAHHKRFEAPSQEVCTGDGGHRANFQCRQHTCRDPPNSWPEDKGYIWVEGCPHWFPLTQTLVWAKREGAEGLQPYWLLHWKGEADTAPCPATEGPKKLPAVQLWQDGKTPKSTLKVSYGLLDHTKEEAVCK